MDSVKVYAEGVRNMVLRNIFGLRRINRMKDNTAQLGDS